VNGGVVDTDPNTVQGINVIPKSRWRDGIPPVMGAHLMESGAIAPLSTSKGPGTGEEHQFYYPKGDADLGVIAYGTPAGANGQIARLVAGESAKAIAAKGSFTIVLTGGSLLKSLSALVGSKNVDWSRWHVFFGDERNVPHSSPDCTLKGAREAFLSKVPIPESQIHAIAEGLPVDDAAKEYNGQMLAVPQSVLPRNDAGFPVFDLILLGVGPDGHICSLFPNRPQTSAKEGWILSIADSPKPPPERITFSMPVVNAAKEVVFVALGEAKAEIVQRVLEVQSLPGALPAQMVRPENGKVTWILDADAASQIAADKWVEKSKDFPRSTS
jgi:6-phosphogluconolactonase